MNRELYESTLEPVYAFNAPGDPIHLYEGPIRGGWAGSRNGVIALSCKPNPEIYWEISHEYGDLPRIDRDIAEFYFELSGQSWKIEARQREWNATGQDVKSAGWVNSASFQRPESTLDRVIVHWMNLPKISGPIGLDDSSSNGGHRSSGRWRVDVDGWKVTLDIRRDYSSVMANSKRESLYVLTHVMEIRRMDGDNFSLAAVQGLIECLRVSLSFAFGHWVAPVLPVGFDSRGEIAWQQWSSPICDRARSLGTAWLYSGNHDDLAELIARAVPAFRDSHRPGITRYQMILAIQAVEAGFMEQRILAAVPALEHLAWENLVLGGRLTRTEYEDRFAEDRLRYLLQEARIPTGIDSGHFPALAAYAEGKIDGPSAVTRVRNRLIHPKTQEDQIYRHSGLVLDTWRLTLHYVTLLILCSIGYKGTYQNPTQGGWAGNSKPVPWNGQGKASPALPPRKAASRRNRGQRRGTGAGRRNR